MHAMVYPTRRTSATNNLNIMQKSKFYIIDRASGTEYNFIPNRRQGLFDIKQPTWLQYFEDIKHMGNILLVYKKRIIARRGF
jgi:hypothetical protein